MKPLSHIQKSRHGIYYLRIQRDGIDRRISLGTRDLNQVTDSTAIRRGKLLAMQVLMRVTEHS
ncbi:MAG: hypothetical protein Q8K83_09515 [Methylotenera sp.]|nr:hypothetical protein [Methylotenera sp.]